jgi:large subunit ribosomal protein L29
MKAEELRNLTDDELKEKVAELKRKLFTLRFQVATHQQDNTAALIETKHDVARALTILNERRQAGPHESQASRKRVKGHAG